VAAVVALGFIAVVRPYLGVLAYDPDEAWLILDGRSILRGLHPYVDFPHHEMPLHLYLLAGSAKLFGASLAGYRMVSVISIATAGFLVFCLVTPFVGSLPALAAEAIFLFLPAQARAIPAVPETPAVALSLIGIIAVLLGTRARSAYVGGIALVASLLVKPTSFAAVIAIVASLAVAGAWRRLRDLAISGAIAAAAGLTWVIWISGGVFTELLRFQLERVGTRNVGMWSIDSGFADMQRIAGIDTPRKFALSSFHVFFNMPGGWLANAVLAAALAGVPVWVTWCARRRTDVRTFIILWPLSFALLNFVGLDFVTPRYFIPFVAFVAVLAAAPVCAVSRRLPRWVQAGAVVALVGALAFNFHSTMRNAIDVWHYGRSRWIADQYPTVVSFNPMLFASTGTEPGCGLANPAITYGAFGRAWLVTERTRKFQWSDERVLACLRANPDVPVVVDWAFYFFTRPGSPLRNYLASDGRGRRLFFSPDALEQWDRPLLSMSPFR
jgi:4-amino-4-deoxy-L-arabinose transferase-like glycosyltransferase